MTHLVQTRFAVQSPLTERPVGQHPALSPEWVERRFQLLRFTQASLNAQSCQDFRWIIYVHPGFAQLDRLWAFDTKIEVVEDNDGGVPAVREGWLITTRLDSDDALHPSAIALLQQYLDASNKPDVFTVELSHGHVVDFATCEAYAHSTNMFLTRYEKTDRRGVLAFSHHRYEEEGGGPIAHYVAHCRWLIGAHECNVMNGVKSGMCRVQREAIRAQYPWLGAICG